MAMSERGRQKVMHAAARIDSTDNQQAAILGGIVRSCIDHRRFDPAFVSHYVADISRHSTLAIKPISRGDVAVMVTKFQRVYRPDEEVDVPA